MQLFEVDQNNNVIYSPEALLLAPFKKLWTKDRNRLKKNAIEQLAYVYFMCDYKSDYNNIRDLAERSEIVKEATVSDIKNFKEDSDITHAMKFYIKRSQTVSMNLLENARDSVERLSLFLAKVDFSELDAKGSLKYNPKQLSDTIASLGKLVDSLAALEDQVKKEISAKSELLKGGKQKSIMEDGA
jgi:hypothetical protein